MCFELKHASFKSFESLPIGANYGTNRYLSLNFPKLMVGVGGNLKTSSSFSAFWRFLQPKNGCQQKAFFLIDHSRFWWIFALWICGYEKNALLCPEAFCRVQILRAFQSGRHWRLNIEAKCINFHQISRNLLSKLWKSYDQFSKVLLLPFSHAHPTWSFVAS